MTCPTHRDHCPDHLHVEVGTQIGESGNAGYWGTHGKDFRVYKIPGPKLPSTDPALYQEPIFTSSEWEDIMDSLIQIGTTRTPPKVTGHQGHDFAFDWLGPDLSEVRWVVSRWARGIVTPETVPPIVPRKPPSGHGSLWDFTRGNIRIWDWSTTQDPDTPAILLFRLNARLRGTINLPPRARKAGLR